MGDDPLPLIGSCLKRIFRWRVPPNWSISDWRNEMRPEAACAAWRAMCDYDQSLNVPLSIFARQRVLTSTLTRYRQEWAYALRSPQEYDPQRSNSKLLDFTDTEVFNDWPERALARLSQSDLWLVEQLFLRDRTEAEVATQIGITQPAISKRKRAIVTQLRRYVART